MEAVAAAAAVAVRKCNYYFNRRRHWSRYGIHYNIQRVAVFDADDGRIRDPLWYSVSGGPSVIVKILLQLSLCSKMAWWFRCSIFVSKLWSAVLSIVVGIDRDTCSSMMVSVSGGLDGDVVRIRDPLWFLSEWRSLGGFLNCCNVKDGRWSLAQSIIEIYSSDLK